MYMVMRNIPSYTWETMLQEKVPRTIITAELIVEERQSEEKAMKKKGKK